MIILWSHRTRAPKAKCELFETFWTPNISDSGIKFYEARKREHYLGVAKSKTKWEGGAKFQTLWLRITHVCSASYLKSTFDDKIRSNVTPSEFSTQIIPEILDRIFGQAQQLCGQLGLIRIVSASVYGVTQKPLFYEIKSHIKWWYLIW